MKLFAICQHEDCQEISALKCLCGYLSCPTHSGNHFNANSGIAIEQIIRSIQQSEYESLQIKAQSYKEALTTRYTEALQERKLEAAPYLQRLQEIDQKYVRILNDLTLEQTGI